MLRNEKELQRDEKVDHMNKIQCLIIPFVFYGFHSSFIFLSGIGRQ